MDPKTAIALVKRIWDAIKFGKRYRRIRNAYEYERKDKDEKTD